MKSKFETMTKYLLSFLVLFILTSVNAQTVERVEINGRIIVDSDDIEGVAIFNTSSNTGTITNAKGEFKLKVTLNDVIEISALQFEKFTVKIDKSILTNKYLTVYLVDQINKLTEVIITPFDMLTGNLITDVESVETFNPDLDAIYFGVSDIYAYDIDDYKSGVENRLMSHGELINGLNLKKVGGLLLSEIFKSSKNKKDTEPKESSIKDLADLFGKEFIANSFNIPADKVEVFIAYVQANNFDFELLNEGKEVQLIEHLFNQSKQFLNSDNDKKD